MAPLGAVHTHRRTQRTSVELGTPRAIASRVEAAMTRTAKCPMCADGVLTGTDGKLDQSGNTHLPTTVWACDVCGCVRYDPANVARWRPLESAYAPSASALT